MSIKQVTYEQLLAERSQPQRPWRQAIMRMIPPGVLALVG
jgi:hypothetical protein